MSELSKKILKVQAELKAPKNQYNSFGKYKYRSAEDILEGLKPLLAKNELLQTISDEIVLVGDRFYIKATVTVRHGEEEISVSGYAREALNKKGMDESQITGTASSYARKYALNGMWAIDDTKDSDTDEYVKRTAESNKQEDKTTQSNNQEYITQQQRQDLQQNAIRLHGNDNAIAAITAMLSHFKLAKTSEIKAVDYGKANQFISDWRKDSEQFEL